MNHKPHTVSEVFAATKRKRTKLLQQKTKTTQEK